MTGLSSELPWARYRFVKDVAPLDSSHGVHLHNLAIAELLFDARNAYLTEGIGVTWEGLQRSGHNLVIRRLEIDFEHEVRGGIPLKVGVRAATRTRRTITFEEAVWRVDPPVAIATTRSVHLLVLIDTPGAIELPDDVVARFEAFEDQPLTIELRQ
jgi:acyl-CoA thioesterase FadM